MRDDEMKIERSGVSIKSEHALVLGSADLTSRCEPTAPSIGSHLDQYGQYILFGHASR